MNLTDYQAAALTTAQPRAFDHDYLVPMIVGEIGELFGQKAKSHWHGWDADKLEHELTSEYGDVAWGTAILLYVEGCTEITGVPRILRGGGIPMQKLVNTAASLHLFYADPELKAKGWIVEEASTLWQILEYNCETVTGRSFEYVLQKNLDKLASRAARGVLQGQGDHR